MKSFTIRLPKKNMDPAGSLKKTIMSAAATKLPFTKWHGIHTKEDPEFSIAYAGPEDLLCFGLHKAAPFSAWNKKYSRPTTCPKCPLVKEYSALDELDLALYKLSEFAEMLKDYEEDPGYDFVLDDGRPVKIHQKFIQVGYDIIPLKDTLDFINKLTDDKKQNTINIIINICNNIFIDGENTED